MDSTSSIDEAPGQAQVLMLRKMTDGAKAQASALLEMLPPLPRATTSRVDLLL